MMIVWKILASLVALLSSGGITLFVLIGLAWMGAGSSSDDPRKEAIDTLLGWVLLACLIISGLSIWQIWVEKFLIALSLNLGTWLAAFIFLFNAEMLIALVEPKK